MEKGELEGRDSRRWAQRHRRGEEPDQGWKEGGGGGGWDRSSSLGCPLRGPILCVDETRQCLACAPAGGSIWGGAGAWGAPKGKETSLRGLATFSRVALRSHRNRSGNPKSHEDQGRKRTVFDGSSQGKLFNLPSTNRLSGVGARAGASDILIEA